VGFIEMTEVIRQVKCTVDDFVQPKVIQALLTIILTLVLAFLVAYGRDVPEWYKLAWFTLLGVYMELPGKNVEI